MWGDEDRPRLSVAQLAELAKQRLADLRAQGEQLQPVVNTTRKLASHFWGSAWMKHLALCEESGWSLAPGRSLLRHGCVLDLRICRGRISARISADCLYDVQVDISPFTEEQLQDLKTACTGKIDSYVSLLEGKLDAALLQQLCDPQIGLLPHPADWRMRCTCPDWCEPCAHAAAAIYAAGCLIDADPSLLFTLRCVPPSLFPESGAAPEPVADFDLAALSTTFGVDFGDYRGD